MPQRHTSLDHDAKIMAIVVVYLTMVAVGVAFSWWLCAGLWLGCSLTFMVHFVQSEEFKLPKRRRLLGVPAWCIVALVVGPAGVTEDFVDHVNYKFFRNKPATK